MDYSDAPSSFGTACHDTDEWQRLGYSWDSESSPQPNDSSDDGVTWRTSSDDGVTWSAWSASGQLTQGDKVEFKFEVSRSQTGTHEFDELKSWVDWNQSLNWDNSEVLIRERWSLDENKFGDVAGNVLYDQYNNDLTNKAREELKTDLGRNSLTDAELQATEVYNNAALSRTYIAAYQIPTDSVLGDIWLRARIVCENSLHEYSDNMVLEANGWHHQGEVEDYKLTIVKKTVVEVPEPTSLVLFAAGLFAIASRRKKLNIK